MSETLTQKSVRSIGWTSLSSIMAKAVAFASQLVIANLLAPDAFGLLAVASSVAAVLMVVQQGGIAQVLISRPNGIGRLLAIATVTSTALGLIVAAVVVGLAPYLAVWLEEPRLTSALPFFAGSIVFSSIVHRPQRCFKRDSIFSRFPSWKLFPQF